MFFVYISCCFLAIATTEKILLMPFLYGSHVYENLHLGNALVNKGHEVYMVLPKVSKHNADVKRSLVKPLTFSVPNGLVLMESKETMEILYNLWFYDGKYSAFLAKMMPAADAYCDAMLHDMLFINSVQHHHFDMVILCGSPVPRCFLLLPHQLNIPYISLTTYTDPWEVGIPALPSFVKPELIEAVPPFTLWQKLTSTVTKVKAYYTFTPSTRLLQQVEPQMTSLAGFVTSLAVVHCSEESSPRRASAVYAQCHLHTNVELHARKRCRRGNDV